MLKDVCAAAAALEVKKTKAKDGAREWWHHGRDANGPVVLYEYRDTDGTLFCTGQRSKEECLWVRDVWLAERQAKANKVGQNTLLHPGKLFIDIQTALLRKLSIFFKKS